MEPISQAICGSWTPSAIYCADTGSHCQNCNNFDVVGTSCRMPDVVQALKGKALPMPSENIRQAAHHKLSINANANAWLRASAIA